jgi:hypothetical protein
MKEIDSVQKKRGRHPVENNNKVQRAIICFQAIDLERMDCAAEALKINRSLLIRLALDTFEQNKFNIENDTNKPILPLFKSKRTFISFSYKHHLLLKEQTKKHKPKSKLIVDALDSYYKTRKIQFNYS